MVSQSTLAGNHGDPIVVDMGDGITLKLILSDGEATEETAMALTSRLLSRQDVACGCPIRSGDARPVETDEERMLRRYRDLLDDLNDMLACMLRETSMNGHTTPQRTVIGMLQNACNISEWVNAEERRMKSEERFKKAKETGK